MPAAPGFGRRARHSESTCSVKRLRSRKLRMDPEDLMPAALGLLVGRARHSENPCAVTRLHVRVSGNPFSWLADPKKNRGSQNRYFFASRDHIYIVSVVYYSLCLSGRLLLHVAETAPEEGDAWRACAQRHSRRLLNANREASTNENRGGAGPFQAGHGGPPHMVAGRGPARHQPLPNRSAS